MNDDGEDEVEEAEDTGTEHAPGTELLASRAPPHVPACPVCAAPRPSERRVHNGVNIGDILRNLMANGGCWMHVFEPVLT